MADPIEEIPPIENPQINVHDPEQVRYWCDRLNCRPDELRVAVDSVGTSAREVKIYLAK